MLFFALLGAASLQWQGNVRWDDVQATDGCFFFSGPYHLGRDNRLGSQADVSQGPVVTVDFGPYRFQGRQGEPLVRESGHDFHGAWVVHESLRGRWDADGFVGTYRYQEREHDAASWGRCSVTARVTILR
jgi:hypothetical protein